MKEKWKMTKKKFLGTWANPSRPNNSHVPKQTTSAVTWYWLDFLFSTLDIRPQVWREFLNTQVGVRHSLYSTKLPSHICQHILSLYVAHSKIRGLVTSVFLQAISSAFSYPESSSVCCTGERPERLLVLDSIFPESVGFQSHRPCLKFEWK